MKAVILAAGIGSRLNPITNDKPKALVKVCGKPILDYQIEAYLEAGLKERDITIVAGYKANQIKEFCRKRFPNIKVIENKEFLTTNNMYSLFLYLKDIFFKQDWKENLILSNGDCIYDSSIVLDIVKTNRNLIACDTSFFSNESMKIKVIESKRVIEISKEIPKKDAFAVSIDLYRFSYDTVKKLWDIVKDYIERKDINKWTEVAINDLIKISYFYPLDISKKKWVEIDNLDDLLYAEKAFSNFDYRKKKVFILDLDGTLYLGNKVFHKAIEFINENWNNFDFYFMTNNTSRSRNSYLNKLKAIGLKNISINNFLTPIYPLLEYLHKNSIKNVYCLCTKDFINELKLADIHCVQNIEEVENVKTLVVGFDTELTYEKLKEASLLLQKGNVKFLLTHPDKVCPTDNGFIPDAGSIALLLESVTEKKPDKIFGKPSKEILLPLLKKYKKEDIVIVGDRLYTDKVLADSTDIDFILVLTGETKREDVEKEEKFPSLILKSFEEVAEL